MAISQGPAAAVDAGNDRLHTLDAMRGVAAMAVVLYHFGYSNVRTIASGYLAVDLFFGLSGIVLAWKYTEEVRTGSILRFFEKRIVRLFPLYFLGFLLGVGSTIVGTIMRGTAGLHVTELLSSYAYGAVMLPDPMSAELLFPLNVAAWSVFIELWLSLLFAVFLARLPSLALAMCSVAAFLVLHYLDAAPSMWNTGAAWHGLAGGAARALVSFPIGMLLYRHVSKDRRRSWVAVLPVVLMVVALAIGPPQQGESIVQDLTVVVLFPLLLIVGLKREVPAALTGAAAFLADISYPAYAIHFPLLKIVTPLFAKLALPPVLSVPIFLCLIIAASMAAARYFDAPVRRRINAMLHVRRTSAGRIP